jgi:hypothetical protein
LKKNSYKIDALLNIAIVGSVAGGAVFGIVEVDSGANYTKVFHPSPGLNT